MSTDNVWKTPSLYLVLLFPLDPHDERGDCSAATRAKKNFGDDAIGKVVAQAHHAQRIKSALRTLRLDRVRRSFRYCRFRLFFFGHLSLYLAQRIFTRCGKLIESVDGAALVRMVDLRKVPETLIDHVR